MALHAPYMPCETDAEQRRWMGLVVRFLEDGEPMAEAMSAAGRIVAFSRTAKRDASRVGSGTFHRSRAGDTLPAPSPVHQPARARRR